MQNEWNIPSESGEKIKRTKKTISLLLTFVGILIIASQAIPLTESYIQGEFQLLKQRLMKDPLPEEYKEYIENEFAYYDPGKSYFENLSQKVNTLQYNGTFTNNNNTNTQIKVDRDYKKDMFINIPSIGINNIKISSNVESVDEKVYDQYLKSGLAHFKGTPLPGDGGNSFIYGHSAVDSFFNKHSNLPETIFTRLEGIDIGDKVEILKDNNSLEYIVRNKKIVSSDDFSILQTQNNKETLTLMTCWPLGIGTKRLVVVAEKY